ncbi:MAG: hypothetical protein L6Q92_10045 [Phycisphaerae bacterium]|nr:hypothetical protein [Phycisphaerae bacterium]
MAASKPVIVSFRVDGHLADLLKEIPDKSAFIREVILRSYYEACPVCRGRGVLPGEISRWARKQLAIARSRECRCCLYRYPARTGRARRAPAAGRYLCEHCAEHQHGH